MVLYNGRLSGLLDDLKQRGEVGTIGCDVVHDPCHRIPLALHYNMLDTRLMAACREGEERGGEEREGREKRKGCAIQVADTNSVLLILYHYQPGKNSRNLSDVPQKHHDSKHRVV